MSSARTSFLGRGAVVLTAIAMLVAPAVATAAFPGADGRIVVHDNRSLYTMNAAGRVRTKLPVDVPGFGGLSVSANSLQVAYSASHQIFVVDIDGKHRVQLTSTDGGYADQPSFAPDGKHIAFVRDHAIWVMGANGSDQHSITPDAAFSNAYSTPAWSPDGRRIAFTLALQIGTMAADGSDHRMLTTPWKLCPLMTRTMYGEEPSWSPDGSRIAFVGPVSCENSRGVDIWTIGADGSGPTNLIHDETTEDHAPTFNPTGTRIAFTRDGHLATMGVDGSAITLVNTGLDADEGPDWGVAYANVRVTARVAPALAHLGKHGRVRVTGTVLPKQVGRVQVVVKRGRNVVARRWVRLRRSTYSYSYVPRALGRYSVVVTVPKGAHHLAASSVARRFTVRA